jgi:Xaa-Pro aminopeptidase
MNFAASLSEQPQRLKLLREEMARHKLAAFFVPLTDEYMNEYVPDCAQRLAWLSGFTGSAGSALVFMDRAYLFVDGRYTLQAEQQVDPALYTIRHVSKNPLTELLRERLKRGERVGYDPWLHTAPWLERLHPVVDEKAAHLEALQANLVDAVWQGRPAAPQAKIFAHPQIYAGETSLSKRQRLAKELNAKGLSAAVISDPASIAWLLNVRGGDVESTPLPLSFAVLHGSGEVDWFVAAAKVADLPSETGVHRKAPETFGKSLQEMGKKRCRVRIDANGTASAIMRELQEAGADVDRGVDVCELPKACKNESELEGVRTAHKIDGLALTRFFCWLSQQKPEALDEMKAENKLLDLRKANSHFLYPSFPSISGAGPNGAIVHYRSTEKTNRKMKTGEFYLIDSGGQYPGGTTDVTRTLAIGAVSEAMKEHFTRVLKGHIALALARFPQGTTGAQLDVLARQYLWEVGLDYDHGTGHGVGAFLGVHEGPQNISSRGSVALQAGMVISNEPGYYLAGHYGIRIENLVAVRESTLKLEDKPMLEFETLTLAPIDRRAIKADMLTAHERAWLNDYHALVFKTHHSALDAMEKAWLEAAAAAL